MSLIPLVGLALAPVTLGVYRWIKHQAGSEWNAATPCLRAGFWLSIVSLCYQPVLFLMVVSACRVVAYAPGGT
jgi:hypothetical protein